MAAILGNNFYHAGEINRLRILLGSDEMALASSRIAVELDR